MKEKIDILIVDDRIDGLLALEAVLDMPDINLVKAQSGREALELLELYEFALILLDVQMPEMDGFRAAELIRQHEKYKLTPIIFVTAIDKDDRYVYRGYEAGAVDYIFKPFEPQILRAKVSIFVELFVKSKRLQEQAELIRESERRERYLRLTELEVESLRRYRNLADAIPHIVWRARSDGTLEYFNKGWTDYTGLTIEQSVGSGWQVACNTEDLNKFLKTWMQAMGNGRTLEAEVRLTRADGQVRWFWVKAVAELGPADTVVAWLGTCTDIHDRKMAEMKLIKAEQDANAANNSKTTFLANMSHEIRTPMNAILGFAELMLESESKTADRTKWVHTIQRNGTQLLKIIDEILDISKVESGRLQMEKIEVNVGTLLDDVRSLLKLQAQDRRLEFDFVLDTPIPRGLISDPTRIRQILLNLVGNSIKFTQKGYVRVNAEWVPVHDAITVPKIRFRISDSGVGINPAHVNKLFEPFMQEDSATTRNYGGTGLGLALSRQLARAMGGDVTLESSTPGQGSVFLVEIQAPLVEGTTFINNLDFAMQSRVNSSKQGDKRLAGAHILLVEDIIDNQYLMSHFLGLAGAEVEIAQNGKEGISKALSGEFDAVLMDIQMPVLDGYEATKQLRSQGYDRPIIALTAHALKEEREKSFEVGCDDHLSKPVEYEMLIEHIAGFLHHDGDQHRVQ